MPIRFFLMRGLEMTKFVPEEEVEDDIKEEDDFTDSEDDESLWEDVNATEDLDSDNPYEDPWPESG